MAEGPSIRLLGRLAEAGVAQGIAIGERKPSWMRAKARIGEDYLRLKRTMRDLDLVTVCEEAGCPNIFECWADGTATFMINGERCTRACGFCLVDTSHPEPPDLGEPERVAEAVDRLGLAYAVADHRRRRRPPRRRRRPVRGHDRRDPSPTARNQVETLISDCKGDPASLDVVFDARPDVLNHNIETVARLQRAVRPSASYARSLAVLARAKRAGLTTKSSIIVGMGRPTTRSSPRWPIFVAWASTSSPSASTCVPPPITCRSPVGGRPTSSTRMKQIGEGMGIAHVEASPLTRSSDHARSAAEAAGAEEAGSCTPSDSTGSRRHVQQGVEVLLLSVGRICPGSSATRRCRSSA